MKHLVKKSLIIAITLGMAAAGMAEEIDRNALGKTARALFQPLPSTAKIDNANPASKEQIKLGQMLYFEPRLSLRGNVSCNSCHNLASYGVDNLSFSPGSSGTLGGRNSPTVLNAALLGSQFWDGRAQDVEEQAGGPLLNPVEMELPDQATAVARIKSIPGYLPLFQEAYGDEDPITFANITHAIGAFERQLLTPSRWDAYLKGDDKALNEQELRGLNTFIEFGCISCHKGVTLGGDSFQKFGLINEPYWEFTKSKGHDDGRFQVTKDEADRFFFRTPQLRNIERTYPYFHDGSVWSLKDVAKIMSYAQLGREISDSEADDIVAFLSSLTGEVTDEMRQMPQLPKSGNERNIPMEYPQ